jgi:molybdate transport system substrate-binding protein
VAGFDIVAMILCEDDMRKSSSLVKQIGAGLVLLMLTAVPAAASDAIIAVAANFTAPAKEIAAQYKTQSGHEVDLSFGASGQLYAQISHGAPFDALLSADNERTQQALREGLGVPGSEFTYAVGKLVLWSANPSLVDANGAVLRRGNFTTLALANPTLAPYGAAAVETLRGLGVYAAVEHKLATGENIAQTFQFISTGNADLGFVAYSQVIAQHSGSLWVVPERLHAPIVQNAVLLKHGEGNGAAKGFLAFVKTPQGAAIIRRFGYALAGER